MDSIEISDRDSDALTITTDAAGVWITCTHGAHEVTVGPLVADDLLAALAQASASARMAHAGTSKAGTAYAGTAHAGTTYTGTTYSGSAHAGEMRGGSSHAGPTYNRG